jgi:hypothetical protein
MRISTTTLETFRLYLSDVVDEAALVDAITGKFVPTRNVELGQAFHSILEKPDACILPDGTFASGGITFPADVVRECLPYVDRSGVFEVKLTKDYRVGAETVTVVAKVDQLLGLGIKEHKTRWDTYEPDRYATSCQWRFYADIFEASSVTYVVFLLSEYEDGRIVLRGVETMALYPYPAMHAECADLVRDFVRFVHHRGLEQYLQPRAEAA